MQIELQPISSAQDAEAWHSIVEMITLFAGQCVVSDLEWDEDELLASFIEMTDDQALRADYESEPQYGIQAAKDHFVSELKELINLRQTQLGNHSPFLTNNSDTTLLIRRNALDTSIAGLAYAWLAMFWAISSSKDYVVINKNESQEFIRIFAKIFEYICCIVMAARSECAVWYFGDSRDVRDFIGRLNKAVQKIGNGTVKNFIDLEANQTGANDAGVDVFAINTRNDIITNDSNGFLVGATIQKSSRRNKIIGMDQITRFTKYFSRGPILQYSGILAIPYPASASEGLDCRDRNCAYLSKNEIIDNLSRFPLEERRVFYVQRPKRLLLRASKSLKANASLMFRGDALSMNWA